MIVDAGLPRTGRARTRLRPQAPGDSIRSSNGTNVTNKDAYNAADTFLKALDAAPMGAGTVLKDQASKGWMETSVLRALAKLDAAAYHCSTVAHLVESAHEKAQTFAGPVEYPSVTKLKPTKMTVAGTFSVQEIAFGIDAFLAAARAGIDFGGTILALHLGMNRRTSISKVLEFLKKAPKPPFAFLLPWVPRIENLKAYRDECVHYRALRLGDHPKPAIDDHLKTGQR